VKEVEYTAFNHLRKMGEGSMIMLTKSRKRKLCPTLKECAVFRFFYLGTVI
jgi:hypothetical protein